MDGDVGWPRQRVGTLQIAAGHDLAYQTLWTGGGTQKFKRKSKAYKEQGLEISANGSENVTIYQAK